MRVAGPGYHPTRIAWRGYGEGFTHAWPIGPDGSPRTEAVCGVYADPRDEDRSRRVGSVCPWCRPQVRKDRLP